MYTVLIPVEPGTDRGLAATSYVAGLPESESAVEAVVLNVFEEFEGTDESVMVRSEDLFDESSFPQSVLDVVEALEESGIEVTARREHGEPAEEIVRVAEEIDADAIAMAAHKRSRVGKVLFGSVTQEVLLSTDRPVTVLSS